MIPDKTAPKRTRLISVQSIRFRDNISLEWFEYIYTRYRTLTIYNVFFEQNNVAEMDTRNKDTVDYVDASDFYSL